MTIFAEALNRAPNFQRVFESLARHHKTNEIEQAVRSVISATRYREVSGNTAVSAHSSDDGEITVVLTGRVSSFYFKQVAQEAVLQAKLGVLVDNQLEVRETPPSLKDEHIDLVGERFTRI